MEARKENKVYQITEQEVETYRADGYDIYNGKKLVKHAVNKTVSIEEHLKALAEIEELKKQLKKKGE